MLKFNCDICKDELEKFGAILYGPPKRIVSKIWDKEEINLSKKFHICQKCYKKILRMFDLNDIGYNGKTFPY